MNCKENETLNWLRLILNEAGYEISPLILGYHNPETGDMLTMLDLVFGIVEVNEIFN
jgi:hypothetical protein